MHAFLSVRNVGKGSGEEIRQFKVPNETLVSDAGNLFPSPLNTKAGCLSRGHATGTAYDNNLCPVFNSCIFLYHFQSKNHVEFSSLVNVLNKAVIRIQRYLVFLL